MAMMLGGEVRAVEGGAPRTRPEICDFRLSGSLMPTPMIGFGKVVVVQEVVRRIPPPDVQLVP